MKLNIYTFTLSIVVLPFKVIIMALKGASLNTICLNLGATFLQQGAVVQVGQPWYVPQPGGRPPVKKWVKSLNYSFGNRKVTALYSDRPIPGKSERFAKRK